ncbi:MAG: AMP-binding protein [SAR202 cluster bacterium]|nr:AMP-binding protein [SAR202 cluster bacterium]HJO60352.1 AMP-binding protein [SAR202 cluster bacterium]|tara:strand:+ start:2324 stop:3898 length:1575 start_codon:yes stop_codon:yes gene_type:complete
MPANITRPSLKPYGVYPVHDILTKASLKFPDKTAIIDGNSSYTFSELEEYSSQFSGALKRLGVSKGDRVGILAPNCAEFVIAFHGISRSGAIVSTINSGYREREIAHQVQDSGCQILVVHESLNEILDEAKKLIKNDVRSIAITSNKATLGSFWELLGQSEAYTATNINPENDLAALPYSSGTTGLSKGVMLSHFNVVSNVEQILGLTGGASMAEDDVILVHLPLFHIYGMNVLMNPCIAAGSTQVMMGRFDMEEFLDLIETHRVTKLFTVPPVGLGLSQYPGVASRDLSCIKFAMFGAAPLSSELQLKISEVLNCPVIQGYGMTESSPVTNIDFTEPDLLKAGSIGPAVSDTEEKIVDVEDPTKELTPGEIGELVIRGPQVMKGYFNNSEATQETITSDGWLHTGDIGKMDEDGYVWILDRKKELIKYKGFQVPPAELEGLLIEHPEISDAAVIGKPDVESGEIPKAFVVKTKGSNISEDAVMSFVSSKVATFKYVREVEFIDAIPKNASGKILRRLLKDQQE